jgi:hypothetical protein
MKSEFNPFAQNMGYIGTEYHPRTSDLEIALMRMKATAETLGYTTRAVRRGGLMEDKNILCTILPQPGDIILATEVGRCGEWADQLERERAAKAK